MSRPSQLTGEAREAAAGARRQIERCAVPLDELVHRLRARPPAFVVTCARGSSDHAATYGKYLIETTVGRAVASVGPSVASTYTRPLELGGALFLVVSQSGRSPDLLHLTDAARTAGALVVGMINDEASLLAAHCDVVLPLSAGVERGIAATKSFLLAGFAFLQLAARWTDDAVLRDAVAAFPDALDAACELDWSPALAPVLANAASAYVLGRGIGLGAALELALKLKETCRIHAEAFSIAEVLHGPVALVEPGFPIIALGQHDETEAGTREAIVQLRSLGANVLSSTDDSLSTIAGVSPIIAPLCQLQSFYLALPALAAARGLDADTPVNLRKVTETI